MSRLNSSENQRQRLLAALRENGSITTIDARRNLDVMMPAARVHELRHKLNFNIQTVFVSQNTDFGKTHKVAMYVLFPGKFNEQST